MFTNPTHTAPPSVSAPTSPPTSPTRRLRGLSYLRSYTSGNNRSSLRARSPPVTQTEALRTSPSISTDSIAAPNSHTPAVVTSGWLPTQRGPVSRVSILEDNVASSRPVTGIASTSAQPALSISTSTAANNTTLVPRLPNYETMTRNRTEQSASAPPAPTILPLPPPAGQTPPSIRFIPHHDPRASRPSLSFPSVSRTLPTLDSVIRVGRYSERDGPPDVPPHIPSSTPVGFKSKVVSRRHCEFWCENSQWYIKDVKSSSGTFLNHLRLSPPGVESKPWPVNDGDVVQLGIDFRGGEEMIFRCVKIRIECNRGWQKALNNFNKTTHRRLRNLAKPKRDSETGSINSAECSICLMGVAPCQSLFVAPCSHVWHYKCIRPILNGSNYPNFLCPNCRAVADLEAEVEEADSEWEDGLEEAIEASKIENKQNGHGNESTDADGDSEMIDAHREGPTTTAEPIANGHIRAEKESTPNQHHNIPVLRGGPSSSAIPASVISASAITPPRAIPGRNESPSTRAELAPGQVVADGPMTPRNDAGPFVLDGGAGRSSTGRDRGDAVSLNHPSADEEEA